jgi:hypothetical protein
MARQPMLKGELVDSLFEFLVVLKILVFGVAVGGLKNFTIFAVSIGSKKKGQK